MDVPPLVASALLSAAALGAITAWLCVYLRVARDYRAHRIDARAPELPEPPAWPAVSIIVPARNEAENIIPCLETLLAQEYPPAAPQPSASRSPRQGGAAPQLEIIVVDDGSTDATADRARTRMGGPLPLAVVRGEEPPPGWMGKQAACMRGAAGARGAWLLFVDADARLHPQALRRGLALCAARRLSLLSFSPRQRCASFWEHLVQSLVYRFLNVRYSYTKVNDPASRQAAAHGAFLLIERRAFEEVGGFAPARHTTIDDAVLAQTVKEAGFAIGFAPTLDLVAVRMYAGARALWKGWPKTAFAFLGERAGALLGYSLLMIATHLLPSLLLAAFMAQLLSGGARLVSLGPAALPPFLALAAFLFSLGCDVRLRRREGFAAWPALLNPLGALCWLALFWQAALRRWLGCPAVWRGRRYPAASQPDSQSRA
ncbi:MAG: glycosyltransferase [Candidatus Tectomicrobia bacterium]|nr:glycosyltransferase [Candidatus Tectomicrobia bacterium]